MTRQQKIVKEFLELKGSIECMKFSELGNVWSIIYYKSEDEVRLDVEDSEEYAILALDVMRTEDGGCKVSSYNIAVIGEEGGEECVHLDTTMKLLKSIERKYDDISHLQDYLDIVRDRSIQGIRDILKPNEYENFTDEEYGDFYDNCDRAYVNNDEVYEVFYDGVEDEDGLVHYFEDMQGYEVMQVYRCLVQLREWQESGCIL